MYLNREEERILNGEYGEVMQKAMEILVALGEIYNADKLIHIKSAHISGVSYYNIGDAGLEFLREFSRGVRVSVKTTLNPCGADLLRWREMGINDEFIIKQIEIVDIFTRIGVEPTLSCTPYLTSNKPNKGDHIAWGESSAVAYANSVLGAMTNRESGISALASALIGKTPRYGMHLREERRPKIRIKVKARLEKPSDYGALAYAISKKIKSNEIPWIEGINGIGIEELKIFSASIATYTGLPIYHIQGITAEWREFSNISLSETIEIEDLDIKNAYDYLNDRFEEVDLIWIGCPHIGIEEFARISKLLKGKSVRVEMWITTSRYVRRIAEKKGYIEVIERSGAKILCDTCIAVAPLKNKFKTLITNSAKAFYYCRGVNNFLVKVLNLDKCIQYAIKGGSIE